MLTEDEVLGLLSSIYDPEIPVDIVNLGLIYSVKISEMEDKSSDVQITMTLTSPGCPASHEIMVNMSNTLYANGAGKVDIDLTWEPPWNQNMMSEDAKAGMGVV